MGTTTTQPPTTTTTTTQSPSICAGDISSQRNCQSWKESNFCNFQHVTFMKNNCCATCNADVVTTPAPTPATTPAPTPAPTGTPQEGEAGHVFVEDSRWVNWGTTVDGTVFKQKSCDGSYRKKGCYDCLARGHECYFFEESGCS